MCCFSRRSSSSYYCTDGTEGIDATGDGTPTTTRVLTRGTLDATTETPERKDPQTKTIDTVGKPSPSTPSSHGTATNSSTSTTPEFNKEAEEFKEIEAASSTQRILSENVTLEIQLESKRLEGYVQQQLGAQATNQEFFLKRCSAEAIHAATVTMHRFFDEISSRVSKTETLITNEIKLMKEELSSIDGRLSKAECDVIDFEDNIKTVQEKLNIVAADTSRLDEDNTNYANLTTELGNEVFNIRKGLRILEGEKKPITDNIRHIRDVTNVLERRLNDTIDTAADTSARVFKISRRVSALETSSTPSPSAPNASPPPGGREESKETDPVDAYYQQQEDEARQDDYYYAQQTAGTRQNNVRTPEPATPKLEPPLEEAEKAAVKYSTQQIWHQPGMEPSARASPFRRGTASIPQRPKA